EVVSSMLVVLIVGCVMWTAARSDGRSYSLMLGWRRRLVSRAPTSTLMFLEQVDGPVEALVIAALLHDAACVRDGGPIAAEQIADLGETHAAAHVRQIHGDLAG